MLLSHKMTCKSKNKFKTGNPLLRLDNPMKKKSNLSWSQQWKAKWEGGAVGWLALFLWRCIGAASGNAAAYCCKCQFWGQPTKYRELAPSLVNKEDPDAGCHDLHFPVASLSCIWRHCIFSNNCGGTQEVRLENDLFLHLGSKKRSWGELLWIAILVYAASCLHLPPRLQHSVKCQLSGRKN